MANRYRHRTYSRRLFVNYSNWDDDILQRTARAMYKLRWPQKSWFTPFEDLDYHQSSWFLRWALEFLHAAMPDGPQADVWYPEEAGKVYHRMSHERCEYDGLEDVRWPQVHNWYEECAVQILNAGLHGIPVDNTAVLPIYLKNAAKPRF
jgi:hypothetical protein